MNIMILSPGRRVELVRYFKEVFNQQGGEVITLDMSPYAPALYEGDKYFIVEKDFNNLDKYISDIIDICRLNEVKSIITLIDPELILIAENKDKFLESGITPIISGLNEIKSTFDKYEFAELLKNIISVIPTYSGYEEIIKAVETKQIHFPIFAKIRNGSGSVGIGKIDSYKELLTYKDRKNYIFQPYVNQKEYGIDVYFDMIDGKIKALFIKEKLAMRAGETDKAVSLYREDIIEMVMRLEELNFRGPIDIDIFEDDKGKLYINEVNPRFGGGYPHAHKAGVDFISKIFINLKGEIVPRSIGEYQEDLIMMKYTGVKFVSKESILK